MSDWLRRTQSQSHQNPVLVENHGTIAHTADNRVREEDGNHYKPPRAVAGPALMD